MLTDCDVNILCTIFLVNIKTSLVDFYILIMNNYVLFKLPLEVSKVDFSKIDKKCQL